MFNTATVSLGRSGMTMYQTRHSGASIDRVRVFRTFQEVQNRVQWSAFSSVARYDSGGRLPLSPAPTPGQAGNTRVTCRGTVDKAAASLVTHKHMTGKYMLHVFGGSGVLTKAINHLGLRGHVLDTKFGPRCDKTPLFSPSFDRTSVLENASQE